MSDAATTPQEQLRELVAEWRRNVEADRLGITLNEGKHEKDLFAQSADTWEMCAEALEELLLTPPAAVPLKETP